MCYFSHYEQSLIAEFLVGRGQNFPSKLKLSTNLLFVTQHN
jgi:hypothetical protein